MIPSMDGARPLAEFTEVIADDLAAQADRVGPVCQGGPRDGQHLEDQLLPERRHPRAVRAAAVVDRCVHPDAAPAQAAGGRPRDGGPARAAQPRARASRRGRGPRPGLGRSGPATGGVRVPPRAGAVRRADRAAAGRDDAGPGVRTALPPAAPDRLRDRPPRRQSTTPADGKRLDAVPAGAPRPARQALSRDGDDDGGAGRGHRTVAGAAAEHARAERRCEKMPRTCSSAGPPSYEACGDDRRAAEAYAGRIEQQAGSLSARRASRTSSTWLRDWWVGRGVCRVPGADRPGRFDDRRLAGEAGQVSERAGRARRATDQPPPPGLPARGPRAEGSGRSPVVVAGGRARHWRQNQK